MKQSRKDLVREYKERKPRPGIFAVRCAPSEETWVGAARNLDTQKNGIWFQLKMGAYVNAELQAAWNAHGADAFAFDTLEEVSDENEQIVDLLLKERAAFWRNKLGAAKVVG